MNTFPNGNQFAVGGHKGSVDAGSIVKLVSRDYRHEADCNSISNRDPFPNIHSHTRKMTIETILAMTERSFAKRHELEAKKDEELSEIYQSLTE